jgi:hypothetical protein
MKAGEFKEAFLVLSENEQMSVLRKLLPVFWRTIKGDPKVRDVFHVVRRVRRLLGEHDFDDGDEAEGGSCCG